MAGAEMVKRSCPSRPLAWRALSMLAIGASSRGAGSAAICPGRLRKVSSQYTSGLSRVT